MAWLEKHVPYTYHWYCDNRRPPLFQGSNNADYYCGVIWRLRDKVSPEEFTRVVGVRFEAYLDELDSGEEKG